jgi:hypothetical protein
MSLEYTLEKLSRYASENPDFDKFMENIKSGHVDISKIELGMVRLAVIDQPGVYRMIPAWKFYGTETLDLKELSETQEEIIKSSTALYKNDSGLVLYQVINAIDGSIINCSLGY